MAITELSHYQQAILLLAALIVLTSFLMLGQSRLLRLVFIFAVQGISTRRNYIAARKLLHQYLVRAIVLVCYALAIRF